MIRNLFGGSKCRTIDVCDIFGDGSGKALYRLDGNANDESGNYHGTETAITYGGGVYERGAVFNGSSSNITNSYTGTDDFSMSFWITTTTVTPSTWKQLIGGISATNNYSYFIDLETNGRLEFRDSNSGVSLATPASTLSVNNAWYNVVVTKSGTSRKVYVNNSLVASDNSGTATVAKPTGLMLGKYYGDTLHTWSGNIDQVRFFNRAITATEVATLYAECAPTSTVDNINPFEDGSLKALYQFNGDATDKTGVYNGTATNVTYATGKFGNCAVFNGTSSYVSNTSFPQLGVTNSISLWFKSTSFAATAGIATWSNGTNRIDAWVNTNQLQVKYNATWYSVSVTMTTATWYHLSISIINGVPLLYLNGNNLALTSSGGTAYSFTSGIEIGRATTASSYYFNGSIDQVRFFNKALTPMEVASLYNETTPMEEPMHSLVDPFKDGSGKALYRLEGNALDESGNYNGTATSVTYGAGRFGRAGVFNGSSSKVTHSTLLNETPADRTVTMWFNTTATTTSMCLFNVNNGSNTIHLWVITNASGQIAVGTRQSNGTYINTAYKTYTSGSFNFITAIYRKSTNQIGISLNGAAPEYVSFDGTTSTQTGGLSIGNSSYGNGEWYSGSIDQVRIFNRALTASEVTALYNEI